VLGESELAPYSFALRRADTYVRGVAAELEPSATLIPFPITAHPAEALERFGE
jgi:hypothetical protein